MPLAPTVKRGNKRRSGRRGGERAPKVNDAVEIWWPEDKTFYRGRLEKAIGGDTEFTVLYDDGETENVDLNDEFWRYAGAQPSDKVLKRDEGGEVVSEEVIDWSDGAKEEKESVKVKGEKSKGKDPGVSSTGLSSLVQDSGEKQRESRNGVAGTMVDEVLAEGNAGGSMVHVPLRPNIPLLPLGTANIKPAPVIIVPPQPPVLSTSNAPAARKESAKRSDTTPKKAGVGANAAANKSNASKEKAKAKPSGDAGKDKADKSKGKLSRKKSISDSNATVPGCNGSGSAVKESLPKPTPPPPEPRAKDVKEEPVLKGSSMLKPALATGPKVVGDGGVVMAQTRVVGGMLSSGGLLKNDDKTGDHSDDDDVPLVSKPSMVEGVIQKKPPIGAGKGKELGQTGKPASSLPVNTGMITKAPAKRGRGRPRKVRKEEVPGAQKQPVQIMKKAPPSSTASKVAPKVPAVPSVAPKPSPAAARHLLALKQMPKDPGQGSRVAGNNAIGEGLVVRGAEGLTKLATTAELTGPRVAKEDSTRSKSSSEKPTTSFAAKRIKKRRPSMPPSSEPAPAAPFVVAPKVVSVKPTEVTTMSKLTQALEDGVNGAANASLKMKAHGGQSGESFHVKKVGAGRENSPGEVRTNKVAPAGNARAKGPTRDQPAQGDAMDTVKNTANRGTRTPAADSGMHARKRPRVEGPTEVLPGTASGRDMHAVHARADAERPLAGAAVTDGHLSAGLNRLKHQVGLMMDERLGPLQSHTETFAEDIRRLMSILLSFKQELEVYKDFVRRSVAEEARNSRDALQDLRMEVLGAVEMHARQVEHNMENNFRNLSASLGVPVGNGSGTVRGMPPQAGPTGQRRDGTETGAYPYDERRSNANGNSATRVVTEVQNTGANRGPVLANGHNDSPTTIANPDQGTRGDPMYNYAEPGDGGKEFEEPITEAAFKTRVTHLVARQVTVWLLETPHEYNANLASVETWAEQTAARTFGKVAEQLMRFSSYTQAYQTLCSSLGNDAVELGWFVSPGVQGYLFRARKNYAAWDPPPSDEEWKGEMVLLKVLGERFGRALDRYGTRTGTDMEACVAVAHMAAADSSRT